MKKIILPIFVLLAILLTVAAASPNVLAKEPKEVKIDCPTISSTLPFDYKPGSPVGYAAECRSYSDEDIAVSNMLVRLSGDIDLDQPPGDVNEPKENDIPPSKVENLPIGDSGKIFYWGPPWGEGPHSTVEYRAKLGACDMSLIGWAEGNIGMLLKSGAYNPDWQAAADFMVEKLSKAAKEIEANIAAECGAKNAIDSPKTGQKTKTAEQKNQQGDEENLFKKALGGFPVFIGEWSKAVSTGMNLREFFAGLKVGADEFFTDDEIIIWEKEQQQNAERRNERLNRELKELLEREPKLTETDVNITGEQPGQSDSPFRLDILNGKAQVRYPGESEWKDIKAGDRIPNGSTLFTGMDTTTVLSIQGKGVVQVQSFTEITINERGLEEAAKTGQTYTDIKLQKGEIEVNIDPYVPSTPSDAFGSQGWGMSIYGPYYAAAVRGTHFWVKQEEGKSYASIGVYEGEVEVSTADDKKTLLTPNSNKPGVVIVSQKISPVKLILAGLILVVVVGGVVLILKRKFTVKGSNKKRR